MKHNRSSLLFFKSPQNSEMNILPDKPMLDCLNSTLDFVLLGVIHM